jgi:hypothetical protein
MIKNTIVDYTKGIKAKYEEEKLGNNHEFLSHPTLALLRDFCLQKYTEGLSDQDLETFEKYFKGKSDLKNIIYNYEIKNFKAIESFLLDINKKTSTLNLNLIAILIDFNPRPFSHFFRDESNQNTDNNFKKLFKEESELKNEENSDEHFSLTKVKKSKITFGVFLIVIITIGFFAFGVFNTKKNCMQWTNDHYEEVSCDANSNQKMGLFHDNPLIKNNQDLIDHFKKIKVCDTTIYFNKNGTPRVWYGKSFTGNHDCFSMPGLHPETGKTLKPISQHIIGKYLK